MKKIIFAVAGSSDLSYKAPILYPASVQNREEKQSRRTVRFKFFMLFSYSHKLTKKEEEERIKRKKKKFQVSSLTSELSFIQFHFKI